MKKKIGVLVVTLAAMVLIGCGSEFVSGAAAGAAATGAIAGATSVYQQQQQELEVRYQAALDTLEKATTEAEKLAAQADAETAKKALEKNAVVMAALEAANTAAKGDWSNTQLISTAVATGLMGWATRYLGLNAVKTGTSAATSATS